MPVIICSLACLAGPAIIGPAEPGRLRVLFGTEPAVRLGQPRIRAAGLQVVDADIAGDAGADGVLALDVAAGRHDEILGK